MKCLYACCELGPLVKKEVPGLKELIFLSQKVHLNL